MTGVSTRPLTSTSFVGMTPIGTLRISQTSSTPARSASEPLSATLRTHRHPGSFQDLQDCCTAERQLLGDLPAGLPGFVRLHDSRSQLSGDPPSLSRRGDE